jgi:plastocyanin
MKKLLILLTACLALTLTFAACGDDDDDDGGGSSAAPTTEQTDTGGGGGTQAQTASVEMKDIKFIPHDITVKAGGVVQWTNNDSVPHTVTKTGGPGADFDSGDVPTGDVFEQEFTEPGTIEYVCTIHPGQDGTITVK